MGLWEVSDWDRYSGRLHSYVLPYMWLSSKWEAPGAAHGNEKGKNGVRASFGRVSGHVMLMMRGDAAFLD